MTCRTAAKLRAAWYATATKVTHMEDLPKAMAADRKRADYRDALRAYMEHRRGCEICRKDME